MATMSGALVKQIIENKKSEITSKMIQQQIWRFVFN